MKRSILISGTVAGILLAFGLLLNSQQASSGSAEYSGNLRWHSLDEALVLARDQNKKLLVDVYTDWCGWCKRMDSDVYANDRVMAALNAQFIPVKINAESSAEVTYFGSRMTQTQFARSAGVTGYPTTLFLGSDGKPITRLPGYVPADRFVSILQYIGGDHYLRLTFEDFLNRSTSKD